MQTPKILVVEDDSDWQARIRERLEGFGYAVALASSGLEARSKLLSAPQDYALILLDPSLIRAGDDREGLVFLDQVRQQGILTPCVLLTGNLTKSLAREVLSTRTYQVSAALEKSEFTDNPASVTRTLQEAMLHFTPAANKKELNESPETHYWGIALLVGISTAAFIAVLLAAALMASSLLNAGGTIGAVLLVLSAALLFIYVLNLWIAILTGRIKGKTARAMGQDALAKIPILGSYLIKPDQTDKDRRQ
jgi:CheY-like chemotaxis protein